jgi:hypothetical protein
MRPNGKRKIAMDSQELVHNFSQKFEEMLSA